MAWVYILRGQSSNNLQNYPVLSKSTVTDTMMEMMGSLNSTASTTFHLEFFGNDKVNPVDYGEGNVFIGESEVTTNVSGNTDFDLSFSAGACASCHCDRVRPGREHLRVFRRARPTAQHLHPPACPHERQCFDRRFILLGPAPKPVLIRGIGPPLSNFGVPGVLADPALELHAASDGSLLMPNDNWKTTQQTEIEVTGLQPTNDLESAILATLPADGAGYIAILKGKTLSRRSPRALTPPSCRAKTTPPASVWSRFTV